MITHRQQASRPYLFSPLPRAISNHHETTLCSYFPKYHPPWPRCYCPVPGDEVDGGQLPGEGAPGGEDPRVHRQRAGGHQEAQPRRAAAGGEGRG